MNEVGIFFLVLGCFFIVFNKYVAKWTLLKQRASSRILTLGLWESKPQDEERSLFIQKIIAVFTGIILIIVGFVLTFMF